MKNSNFIIIKFKEDFVNKYSRKGYSEYKKIYNEKLTDAVKNKNLEDFEPCIKEEYLDIIKNCIHAVSVGNPIEYAVIYTCENYGTIMLYESFEVLLNSLLFKNGKDVAADILTRILKYGNIEDLLNLVPELDTSAAITSDVNSKELEKDSKTMSLVIQLLEDKEMKIDLLDFSKFSQIGMSICCSKYFKMPEVINILKITKQINEDFNNIVMKILDKISARYPELKDLSDIQRGCVFELLLLKEAEVCLLAIENIVKKEGKTFVNIREEEKPQEVNEEDILSQVRDILKGKNK